MLAAESFSFITLAVGVAGTLLSLYLILGASRLVLGLFKNKQIARRDEFKKIQETLAERGQQLEDLRKDVGEIKELLVGKKDPWTGEQSEGLVAAVHRVANGNGNGNGRH